MTEETALYRVWGDACLLLYIGISEDFGRRWKQHAKKQPWWGEKRRLAVDAWFSSREEAEAAEEAAIKAEHPKYNKQYLVSRLPRVAVPDGWMTVSEAAARAGCTTQAIYRSKNNGSLQASRLPAGPYVVSEGELERWAASARVPQQRKSPAAAALTERQSEFLRDLRADRLDLIWARPHFVTTAEALKRRGLVEHAPHGYRLTLDGEQAATALQAELSSASAA